jgi:enediyne biosynthesis protein E5
VLGMRLNLLFTGRVPTIAAWLATFIVLAVCRGWLLGKGVAAELVVLTGIPMVLFTLYMITDPQTSPSRFRSQILFGAAIAVSYSMLLMLHVNFTMFYSVTVICTLRGLWLLISNLLATHGVQPACSLKNGLGYLKRLAARTIHSPSLQSGRR